MIFDLHLKRRANASDLVLERDFEVLFNENQDGTRSMEVLVDLTDEQRIVLFMVAQQQDDQWVVVPRIHAVLGPHIDRVTATWLERFLPPYVYGDKHQTLGAVAKHTKMIVHMRCSDAIMDLYGYTVHGSVRNGKLVPGRCEL